MFNMDSTKSVQTASTRKYLTPARLDNWGVGLSSLCIVHCFLTPILLALAPALGSYVDPDGHAFHIFLLILLLPIGIVAFWRGYQKHKVKAVMAIGFLGLITIISAIFLPESASDQLSSHVLVNSFGSLFLVTGHYLNRRYCRICEAECCHQHRQ